MNVRTFDSCIHLSHFSDDYNTVLYDREVYSGLTFALYNYTCIYIYIYHMMCRRCVYYTLLSLDRHQGLGSGGGCDGG